MTSDEHVDRMGDVIALVTARVNDDIDGFKQIINNNCDIARMMLGLTDLCVSLFRVQASTLGIPVRTLLKTIGIITKAVAPEVIEKMERGY